MNYDRKKSDAAATSLAISKTGRDIGKIPKPKNSKRRKAAKLDFQLFCQSYFPNVFVLKWSNDHLKVIKKIESAVLQGGLFAVAMPRGSGKSSFAEVACIWALFYGHRKFVMLVASDAKAAQNMLDNIKAEMEMNELLAADFPEVCYPIAKLDGILNRCPGQHSEGNRTNISWTSDEIILPTVKGSVASGGLIRVAGITGRIRGAKHNRADGESVRPDLFIADDPQTEESARSLSQCKSRLETLNGAVLGLAGPGRKIAGIMPCTVIRKGDLADEILDQSKCPEWQGERTKLVYQFPENVKLWDRYAELRAESLRMGRGLAKATEFYQSNRIEMDAGSLVAWEQRFNPDELSAIQHAMNLKYRDETSFAAEYQNDPLAIDQSFVHTLTKEEVVAKVNGLNVGIVPLKCNRVTAYIDVQGKLLYYLVMAWGDDFTGAVLEYGTFPDQKRQYYTLHDAQLTFESLKVGMSLDAQLMNALQSLADSICTKVYVREDGQEYRISRCIIDANWGQSTAIVKQFCRTSKWAAFFLPGHGRAVGADRKPMNEYIDKPGERFGWNWRIPAEKMQRHIIYDTYAWKTFIINRVAMAVGESGGITIYQGSPEQHRMLAEQWCAEYSVPVTGLGRTVNVWSNRPGRDNHWFDCLIGCAVGASEQGILALGHDAAPAEKKKRNRRRLEVAF